MTDSTAALAYVEAHIDDSLDRLFALMRVPSISTDPAYAQQCQAAARQLADELTALGFSARVAPTPGHPMVVAHHDGDGPHVLFYGHYDVQPVDPLELWKRDPFDPVLETRSDGTRAIVGRGASDDKGQLRTFIEACRAWKATAGRLPVRVTILFEGEEESGSESLEPFLHANADELKADFALICDTSMWDTATPGLTIGLRGMAGGQVTVRGPSRDLHSGLYGGPARNPIQVLTGILADLKDDAGHVTLAGFYDGVHPLSADVEASWNALGFDARQFLGDVGLSVPAGEAGVGVLEQSWARPTAEINGIWGGYTGEGFKTVIPAEVHAKVSFRLVGDQDPDQVWAAFEDHVRSRLPADCAAEFKVRGGSRAISLASDSPPLAATRAALDAEWGKSALLASGGSIPVVNSIRSILGMDSVMVGFALNDDNIHSPNEKYDLNSFHKGIRSWVRILEQLGAMANARETATV
ncbi:acetylornithine deacetylase/succinyl-diaminopimelate desuccinylase-like protein [Sphingomonas naasensis]|uniref:M20/M25/M40 family metallo-hydrolase n=1 Tax=Sphingomonas naasensis TaxID=1344951 RepID=A0A4S1WFS9_9SPHN|nr:M20/M25/M40 family metallo-hydrolase [Sphingomonas naasensis]NIJ21585.1 acetylornithine deacetylase/succinyl-diaminopimelate desuccinylase-like protein [Sphingomonas naasensis]TGX41473.1 M20/M25/M40 family metallo-hydrolase [Sphingomonas naasensis]